ncbi:uncharacterized protein LOC143735439 [Siphateles boraxobius]|uniref:uncharacterized protein LOC143735439 n=1 Tax=Siphateles boraxobius TaxID=180520 RepID=UPI004063F724
MERSILVIFLWLLCAESGEMTGDFYTNLPLPTPKITRNYDECPSSVTKCMVECSAVNVSHVTLSWYKGSSLQSNVSVSDFKSRIFLHLEVEYQDKKTYRCVINNPISQQTQHLNVAQICQTCEDIEQSVMPVKEGDDVILHANLATQKMDQLLWIFQNTPIAELTNKSMSFCNDVRFSGRLILCRETGDLTITNITKQHSGYYKLLINSVLSKCWGFNVTVYAHLPVPVITRDSQCSSSSECSSESRCSLVCSVFNVSHVTLSWYKGISVLSSISVSDLSISLSLPLEVEYQDKNTYSCGINNPVSNQTTHLDITQLCPVQSNDQIVEYVGAVVAAAVLVVLIGAIVKLYICKPNQTKQEVAAGGDPPERNPDENDALISTPEYVSLNNMCFK